MPRYQLHIVKEKNGENVRQPIVECADVAKARSTKLKRGEQIVAATEVNEEQLRRDHPDGHPLEQPWEPA